MRSRLKINLFIFCCFFYLSQNSWAVWDVCIVNGTNYTNVGTLQTACNNVFGAGIRSPTDLIQGQRAQSTNFNCTNDVAFSSALCSRGVACAIGTDLNLWNGNCDAPQLGSSYDLFILGFYGLLFIAFAMGFSKGGQR